MPRPNFVYSTNELTFIVGYAFEKSDAQEKYGHENVFLAGFMGGRSLRFTAERVYGFACTGRYEDEDEEKEAGRESYSDLCDRVYDMDEYEGLIFKKKDCANFFNDIGGVGIWKRMIIQNIN